MRKCFLTVSAILCLLMCNLVEAQQDGEVVVPKGGFPVFLNVDDAIGSFGLDDVNALLNYMRAIGDRIIVLREGTRVRLVNQMFYEGFVLVKVEIRGETIGWIIRNALK